MNPGDRKALVIARRSRKNLDFMYAQKRAGADVEEFTQLLNSMLGMLICLREEYFKGREVTWEQVAEYGLLPIRIDGELPTDACPNLEPSSSFSKLISKLRHAFAHNCFDLIGNPIEGVRVWNIPLGKEDSAENRVWQADVSESQLRQVADLFINFLETEHGHELPQSST